MKTLFDRLVHLFVWVSVSLCGLALVDFILHPLAPDFTFHSILYRTLVVLLFTPLYLLVGFLIIRRVPGNIVGPLLILYAGTVALGGVRTGIGANFFALFAFYEITIGWEGIYLLPLHFPDGKIDPPRASILVYLAFGFGILLGSLIRISGATLYDGVANPFSIPALGKYQNLLTILNVLVFSPVLVLDFLSPVLRFRKGSPLERQQIKWLAVLGGFLAASTVFGFVIYPLITGRPMFSRADNAFSLLFFSSMSLLPPLAIGFAVLHYHLWDIDIIIRKTLSYGLLTAALALVFFGGVALLQEVIVRISGTANSPVAIVLSTLAVAGLFSPLRRRIQDGIDQRFFRHKYNAEQALSRFAAAARAGIELEQLSTHLVGTVQTTLQPEQTALWLRHSPRESAASAGETRTGGFAL